MSSVATDKETIEEVKEIFKEQLGKRVKHFRNKRGYTLRSLAQKINYTPGYIGLVEQGKSQPSCFVLRELSEALNVPMSALLGEEKMLKAITELKDPILSLPESKEYLDIIKKAISDEIPAEKIDKAIKFVKNM